VTLCAYVLYIFVIDKRIASLIIAFFLDIFGWISVREMNK